MTPVAWSDLLPTLCEAAGVATPEAAAGRSLMSSLRGEPREARLLHGQRDERPMRHDGRFKYLRSAADRRGSCVDNGVDPPDEHPDSGEPPARMRRPFVARLAEEGHERLPDEALANEQPERHTAAEARAREMAGVGPAGHLGQALRDVRWIGRAGGQFSA